MRSRIFGTTTIIADLRNRKVPIAPVHHALSALQEMTEQMDVAGATPYAVRAVTSRWSTSTCCA